MGQRFWQTKIKRGIGKGRKKKDVGQLEAHF